MKDRDACIILNMISGIGSARLEALTSHFGSPSAILQASAQEISSVKGVGAVLAEKVADWKNEVSYEMELELAEKGGVRIITQYDPEYPEILKEIYDPPICLYVRGELPLPLGQAIAVVGSRRISNYGRKMAKHLSEAAVYAGWTVVSGLAYGIDAVAHQAALDAGGKTIAVLGGGLARIHPQDHIPLAREIINNGALISEFPMEFPVSRQSFPRRNRIVSGLSKGVLVIEAGLESGALITANQALEQGRLVFAVPGNADNPQAKGSNSLIRQGAKLTESFEDILEEFEFLPGFEGLKKVREEAAEYSASHEFSEEEKRIISILESGDTGFDSIAMETGIPAGKLLASLMKLEMKKTINQLPGKVYSVSARQP
ncbi:MAG: DNA protecting protein DprA [Lentisphaerae bacterium GWF2_44_16]|nr:MAG: DNA protecting protein DprA [Lentisphaerae bacterium GWF2_44_16]